MRTSNHVLLGLATLVLIAAASSLSAGPLNPPAGPVSGTSKTLTEVEPRIAINSTNTPGDVDSLYKITQPGSYYLIANINGAVDQHGIEITTSGVTIDLNGFDVVGPPQRGLCDGVIATVSNLQNIAVVNGSVRLWGRDGINLGDLQPSNCRIENISATGNGRVGIFGGVASRIINCAADANEFGLSAQTNSQFSDCSASNNYSVGLTVPWGSTATNCSAFANSGGGINTYTGSALLNCSAYQNTGTGITTEPNCTVTSCTATQNTFHGITTGTGCTITSCSTAQNGFNGVSTGSGCTISDCTASSNGSYGFSTGDACAIMNGTSVSNFRGFVTGTGSTVAECTARSNTSDGILLNSNCVIRANTCSLNGVGAGDGAGIHANSGGNRIEGNHCSFADRGIDVDTAGNTIIQNTCSSNTINWDVAVGNSIGAIVVAGTNASAISGNGPVASTLGSTDPHANFSN